MVKMSDIIRQDSRLTEDIKHYQQCLQAEPKSRVFLPLAKAYCKAGRYKEAVAICRQGLARYPDYWAAQVVLGQAYLEQDMLDEALSQLEAVVREAANNLLAGKLLGQVYIKQGRIKEAVARYTTILNYHPECDDLKETLHKLTTEKSRKHEITILVLEEWLKEIRAHRNKTADNF